MAAVRNLSENFNPFSPDTILSTVLESAAEGMMLVDTDLNIRYFNKAAEIIFGHDHRIIPLEEWKEKFLLYQLGSEVRMAVKEMPVSRLIGGENFSDVDTKLEIAGTTIEYYLSWNGKALWHNGIIIGGVLTFRDIRERVKYERELQDQRNFFKVILDLIPALIYVRNLQGDFIFTNTTYDIYLNELSRLNRSELVDELLATLRRHDDEILKIKCEKEFRDVFRLNENEERIFRTIRFPVLDQNGEVQFLAGIAFDETLKEEDQKMLKEERAKSIDVSRLASIGTLASEIGHEINGPLAVIRSITFLLKEMIRSEDASPAFILEKLNSIDETVDRMNAITNSLRNISRKPVATTKEECFFSDILQDVLPLINLKFRRHGIKLIYNAENETVERKFSCWRTQLSQVLFNLLTNAADALESTPNPWVKLLLNEDENFFYLRIVDNGSGVPESIRSSIFDPFFTTKAVGKGTGLGLSISRNIVIAHGGEIYLDQAHPHTCFVIKLPK